jgi:hypothetical protein
MKGRGLAGGNGECPQHHGSVTLQPVPSLHSSSLTPPAPPQSTGSVPCREGSEKAKNLSAERTENLCPHRNLCMNVYGSMNSSSQKRDTTEG